MQQSPSRNAIVKNEYRPSCMQKDGAKVELGAVKTEKRGPAPASCEAMDTNNNNNLEAGNRSEEQKVAAARGRMLLQESRLRNASKGPEGGAPRDPLLAGRMQSSSHHGLMTPDFSLSGTPTSMSQLLNSTFSTSDGLEFASPVGSGIISPLTSTRLGRKRALSSGSMGHLSPSLFYNPTLFQPPFNKPIFSPGQSQSEDGLSFSAITSNLKREPSSSEGEDTTCDTTMGMTARQLETLHEEGDSSEDEGMHTDNYSSAFTESELERDIKPKRIYYSYPSVEEPHNNRCQWNDCEQQCESLEDLVKHVNTDHIYK